MKRAFFFFVGISLCLSVFGLGVAKPVYADSGITVVEAFPDSAFREWIMDKYLYDAEVSETGNLTKNQMERIRNVTEVYVPAMGITSLKGIEYFENLYYLDCSSNQLTDLDVSKNLELSGLNCASNQLTELDVSANLMLDTLNCSENQLSSLDISRNVELRYFDCSLNQIDALNLSANPSIRHLMCFGNHLTRLDLSHVNQLMKLDCSMNRLKEILLNEHASGVNLIFGEQIIYTNVRPSTFNGQWMINIREILGDDFDLSDIRLTDSGTFSANTGVITYSEQPSVVRFEKPIGKLGVFADYSIDLSETAISSESAISNKTIIIISAVAFIAVSAAVITIVLLHGKKSKTEKQKS